MKRCSCSCSCCAATTGDAAGLSFNPPGFASIAFRRRNHGRSLRAMLAAVGQQPELQQLTTREPGDPAIALLDCWALVADTLSFYTERIANEGYLQTATESESLMQLGRLVGYTPRPALGSSTYLAYTLSPGAVSMIPTGSQAKNVAAQGQLPQTFETSADVVASTVWNTLTVRATRPAAFDAATLALRSTIVLAGASTNLRAGDRLLFLFGPQESFVRIVAAATPDLAAATTVVELVPLGPTGVEAALLGLGEALQALIEHAPTGPVAGAAVASARQAIKNLSLSAKDRPRADVDALGTLSRRLAEWLAIAAGHDEIGEWRDGAVAEAARRADATLELAATAQRRQLPQLAALQRLAAAIACPDDEGPRRSPEECATAVPLVSAAAMLPALRRPPARVPTLMAAPGARDVSGAPSTGRGMALVPQSDSALSLLAATDLRLAGALRAAIGRQAVTAPTPTSGLQVMRVKARALNPAGDASIGDDVLLLDGAFDAIVPGSWVVTDQIIGATTETFVNRVLATAQYQQLLDTHGAPSGPDVFTTVTWVQLDGPAGKPTDDGGRINYSRIVVWAAGEPLHLADEPIADDVGGATLELNSVYDGLTAGRLLAVTGERTDVPGTPGIDAGEVVMIAAVEQKVDASLPGDATRSSIELAVPLSYTYRRSTVTVFGNVVGATQGESRTEVLGSGDASQSGQRFALRQVTPAAPLTRLPADTPGGEASTLVVRVDGEQWTEVADLGDASPADQVFTTATDADGSMYVVFGDGVHGTRLPSGVENVTARYRVGAGLSGDVAAASINQLTSRPAGVTNVVNPVAATGGTPADSEADRRVGTPRRALALDRLVSVEDYADLTGARTGIAKATAAHLYDGRRPVVHVTVAAAADAPIDPDDALLRSLRQSLVDFGDPSVSVRVGVRRLVTVVVSAGVKVLPRFDFALVEPKVRAALLDTFSFAKRDLAQPVRPSEVIATIQAVDGVDYVDLDVLGGIPGDGDSVSLVGALAALTTVATVPARQAAYERVVHLGGINEAGDADTLSSIALRAGLSLAELAALNPTLTGDNLQAGQPIVVFDGIRPAQLAIVAADIPQTIDLRSIR